MIIVGNIVEVGKKVVTIISAVMTLSNTHPLLICYNIVAAMLLGQMRCQDIKAPAELRKYHVVWVSWSQGGSRTERRAQICQTKV